MTVLVSVIVPTCRRPQLVDRCLQALLSQSMSLLDYEIIIVDDCPEDNATRTRVTEWQQRLQASFEFAPSKMNGAAKGSGGARQHSSTPLPVTGEAKHSFTDVAFQVKIRPFQAPGLFYLPAYHTRGPAAARNLGWRFAAGEIIAFTDDDCIPDPNWLANGVAAFRANTAGVSGQVVVPLPPDPTDHDRNTTGLERSDFVTANCFYRRCVLEEIGGFDERFQTAWREDSDLYFSLRERGYALAWASQAIVNHPVRPEAWGASIRHQRKSFYNALLYKKHPDLYQQIIQPAPPWHYYAMLMAFLIFLAGLLLQQPLMIYTGGLSWLLLEARFTAIRLRNTSRRPAHIFEMAITSAVIPFLSIYWRLRGALHWRVFFL